MVDHATTLVIDASVWIAAARPREPDHAVSRRFVAASLASPVRVVMPVLTRLEIGCALARRLGHDVAARFLAEVDALPVLHRDAPDAGLLGAALTIGMHARLRSLDACMAAAALAENATLVTWDRELVERAGAITPTTWMDALDTSA